MTDQTTGGLWDEIIPGNKSFTKYPSVYNFDSEQISPAWDIGYYQDSRWEVINQTLSFAVKFFCMQSKLLHLNHESILKLLLFCVTIFCHLLKPKTAQQHILRRIEFIWVPSNSQDCSKEYYCIVLDTQIWTDCEFGMIYQNSTVGILSGPSCKISCHQIDISFRIMPLFVEILAPDPAESLR